MLGPYLIPNGCRRFLTCGTGHRLPEEGHLTGGALAFAADDLEQVRVAPVHVGLRLLGQRADPLELLERLFEALGADTVTYSTKGSESLVRSAM